MSLTLNSVNNNQALRQARALVGGMSPRQRLMVGGGVVAVVAGLALFVHLMAKPNYTLLYASLQPADGQEVASSLSGLGIPYDLSADGASISVPSDQLDHARLELASRGLPRSGQLGFELFDRTNWSGSDFDEQVNYQRALEGELERTIETIRDVQSARVHITMAHDSLFTAEERGAKAAVLLTLRDGSLDPGMVTAIQHLVASAVDHLVPQNVAILDANGELSLAGSTGPGGAAETQLEGQLSAKILATLDPIVGAQHVRANVAVEYDPTSADDTQETYDPNTSAVLTSQRTSVGGPGAATAAGVPGTTSNLPKAQAAGTNFNAQLGLSGGTGQQSDSQTFAVSRSVNHVIRPAGTIQRISAAVVVDDAEQTVIQHGHRTTVRQPRTPAELQQMQSLVAAAIGLNPARGDVLTVSNLAFVAPALLPDAAPTTAPATDWLERLSPKLRWTVLGAAGLGLLLLLGTLLWLPTRRRPAPPVPAQIAAGPEAMAAAAAVAEGHSEMLNMKELLAVDPEETPPEIREVLRLKDRLATRVRREPAIASRLVQGWMNKNREEHL